MPKKAVLLEKISRKPYPKNFTTRELDQLMRKCCCEKFSGGRGSGIGYVHTETKRILQFDQPYLELCEKIGKIPEKEFKGSFNIRISPEVHKQIALVAAQKDISLNRYVANVIEESLNPKKNTEQLIMYFPKKCVGAYFKLSKQQTQKKYKKDISWKKEKEQFCHAE